ncbi:MAG: exodeoxyribonuclease VII large subunit [Alkalispirochaeta sp.]
MSVTDEPAAPVFAVSEITGLIKDNLERSFSAIVVAGEVSNFKAASSGHWYFSLRDAEALLPCAMFRGSHRNAQVMPRDGDNVEVFGSISVYPPRGSYQLIAQALRPAGRGRILALLEERKERLAAAGLFQRELRIPPFPRTVAVVTSPTGAAIRDIIQVLRRRRARIVIRVVPVPVQGDGAGDRIARGITYASHHRLGEAIIVGRGGGSLEDLLPFSDEAVIRAIAASKVPVISAVGHETDWALSDYAADLRAPTPSAAAELVSLPDSEVLDGVRRNREDIVRSYRRTLEALRRRLAGMNEREIRYRFRNYVQPWYQRLDEAKSALSDGVSRRLIAMRHRYQLAAERLSSRSPYEPLERGYALVRRDATEEIVSSAADSTTGEYLRIQFRDGMIRVERKEDARL